MKYPNDGPESLGNKNAEEKSGGLNHTSWKKRKAEDKTQSTDTTSPLVCYDMRQVFASDDIHENVLRRRIRQSDTREVCNWVFQPTEGASSSRSQVTRRNKTPQHTNREGSVGHKPPESG